MKISTFQAFNQPEAKLLDLDWEAFVRMLDENNVETKAKQGVGLFNATTFADSYRRRESAQEVSLLILDFDNALKDPTTGEKKRHPNAVKIQEAAAKFQPHAFVLATSFSHTEEWHRFRVIIPLAKPVPAKLWRRFATAAVETLLPVEWRGAVDRCYLNPAQAYYWPCCPEGGETILFDSRIEGANTVLDLPVPEPKPYEEQDAEVQANRFTAAQIARYYAARIPSMSQTDDAYWRAACPLHKGTGKGNFQVHKRDGMWYCHSECQEGGDIYSFEMKQSGARFAQARMNVHKIIGGKPGTLTTDEAAGLVKDSKEGDVPALLRELARIPSVQQRRELLGTLALKHGLSPEGLEAETGTIIEGHFPGTDTAAAKEETGEEDDFKSRYVVTPQGVFPQRVVQDPDTGRTKRHVDRKHPIATRPVWVAAVGEDLATDRTYVSLAWEGADGSRIEKWVPASLTNDRTNLSNLADVGFPVSIGRVAALSDYLADCRLHTTESRPVCSALGWAKERFVLEGDPIYEYIGKPLPVKGDLAGWAAPLEGLVALGTEAFPALVVLGLSAAAPVARLVRKRSPVVGLVNKSSTGKGSVINYALAIWGDPASFTVAADSTVKGLQDHAIKQPDLPLFIDELHNYPRDKQVSFIYFLGNGQRRTVSGKTLEARGGEKTYGPKLYAAEDPIADGLKGGALSRIIEITGAPLPDVAMSDTLQTTTRHHYGAVGRQLARIINADQQTSVTMVERAVEQIRETFHDLKGDDAWIVAQVMEGLRLLNHVTDIEFPIGSLSRWLAGQVTLKRQTDLTDYEDCWTALIDMLMSKQWTAVGSGPQEILTEPGGFVAFRGGQCYGDTTVLEIVPTSETVRRFLTERGLNSRTAVKKWKEEGWIVPQGPHATWPRNGSKAGKGARTWRVCAEGVAEGLIE